MAEPSSSRAGGVEAELREVGRGLSALEMVKKNFDDPKQEWRRLFAEILGTFFLVLVSPILGVVIAVGFASLLRGRADVGGAAAAQGAIGPLVVGPDPATPGGAPGS